jgi:hypothetical protein
MALTIYLTRPPENTPQDVAAKKADDAMGEINKLRDQLARAQNASANSANEITRLKMEYQALVGRVGSISVPTAPSHAPDPDAKPLPEAAPEPPAAAVDVPAKGDAPK